MGGRAAGGTGRAAERVGRAWHSHALLPSILRPCPPSPESPAQCCLEGGGGSATRGGSATGRERRPPTCWLPCPLVACTQACTARGSHASQTAVHPPPFPALLQRRWPPLPPWSPLAARCSTGPRTRRCTRTTRTRPSTWCAACGPAWRCSALARPLAASAAVPARRPGNPPAARARQAHTGGEGGLCLRVQPAAAPVLGSI